MIRKQTSRLDNVFRRRKGLTALELLVIFSVLGILMSLIIPAVVASRERARQLECASRLRNCGQAIHGFHTAHQYFPSADEPTKVLDPARYSDRLLSPHYWMLPYLEQAALQKKVSPAGTFFPGSPGEAELSSTRIATFLCPSDSVDLGTNYRACTGSAAFSIYHAADPGDPPFPGNGAFCPLYRLRVPDFQDGLGQTVAMSEKLKSDSGNSGFDRRRDYWFSGAYDIYYRQALSTRDVVNICAVGEQPPPGSYYKESGSKWVIASYAHSWYNHAVGPNASVPDCSLQANDTSGVSSAGVFGASSHHSGGVNTLFMDGSVQFVNDHVDITVWHAIATRKNGEVVSGLLQ